MHPNHTQQPIESDTATPGWLAGACQSVTLIVCLTVAFGTISYGFIQLNAAVLQLSIPDSMWCGLTMGLAVFHYWWQQRRASNRHSDSSS